MTKRRRPAKSTRPGDAARPKRALRAEKPVVAPPPQAESAEAEPIDAEVVDAEPLAAETHDADAVTQDPLDAEPIDAEPIDAELIEDPDFADPGLPADIDALALEADVAPADVRGAQTPGLVRAHPSRVTTSSIGPLARYLADIRDFGPLEQEDEQRLARLLRETGDADAARQLVTANLILVVKLALMYRRALRNVMDLVQEGNVGLMEAVRRFDPDQGVRFTTYASWWIKAYMLKFLLDNARLVRVGTTNARRKLLYNLRREQRKLEAQGIAPTPKLLAERFGVSEADVVDIDRALSSGDVSIDAPLGEDSSATVGDLMPARGASVEEQVATLEIRERIERAIAAFRETLGERDQTILDLRLVAEEPVTLQELGDRFGVTREAMRQAETKLKARLATFLRDRLGDDVILHFSGS